MNTPVAREMLAKKLVELTEVIHIPHLRYEAAYVLSGSAQEAPTATVFNTVITPEQLARQQIDAMLLAPGWLIQDYKALNFPAGQGIALREVPLTGGRCDYLLLVDRIPVGVVEAKKKGATLSTVADQSGFYAENLPAILANLTSGSLRFLYKTTVICDPARDRRRPRSRPRAIRRDRRQPETVNIYGNT